MKLNVTHQSPMGIFTFLCLYSSCRTISLNLAGMGSRFTSFQHHRELKEPVLCVHPSTPFPVYLLTELVFISFTQDAQSRMFAFRISAPPYSATIRRLYAVFHLRLRTCWISITAPLRDELALNEAG